MKRKVCLGVVLVAVCGLTGCEQMEHGPAMNLPFEVTEHWIDEVHAEVSAETDIEDIKADIEKVVEEVESAVSEAERLAEELTQGITKEAVLSSEVVIQDNIEETVNETTPEVYEFTHSEKEYFEDALFIGDSRTMGLKLYGTLDNADYFAEPGLSLYSLPRTKLEVGEYQKIGLEELLEKETYGKIYLMLGINELGYHFDTTLEKYHALVKELHTKQPEAILYVCANLHVTSVRDEHDEIHNNANIDKINAEIATIADEQNIFYLDVNVLFDDEEGNLDKEIASDDAHILGEYYEDWCQWLGENTIVK